MSSLDDPLAADLIARQSAAALLVGDQASTGLGMTLDHVAAGSATVSMVVTSAMVNGHGTCHGGFVFTLADSAFAFACNSRNQRHVAQSCQITYVAPARLGMRLTAVAHERHRAARSGITDVTVRDETGATIAEFRGASRSIPGLLVEGI
jgi:acyl-CoA thioesterase